MELKRGFSIYYLDKQVACIKTDQTFKSYVDLFVKSGSQKVLIVKELLFIPLVFQQIIDG